MRLLDTYTMKLENFQQNIPPYAIFSHVWEVEEVTFQDMADLEKAKKMYGYAKIASACDRARRYYLGYIWIDTCCINKESSAELSEAINSMYTWYRNAAICYAYLSDVPSEGDHKHSHSLFSMSRWFTRGWTLQELIAPRRLIFYSRDWVDIGTKASLQDAISSITGISTDVIVGEMALDEVPIAVRMSWAANRNTTRVEDIAYSLMGIFNVNMPLLYGEGRKAFIRLQHEIIEKSTDHSIFAWRMEDNSPEVRGNPISMVDENFDALWKFRGILARSPQEFRNSGNVERILESNKQSPVARHTHVSNGESLPYAITNRGLRIELPVVVHRVGERQKKFAFLNCRFSGESEPIVLALSQSQPTQSTTSYFRSEPMAFIRTPTSASFAKMSSIYIVEDYYSLDSDPRVNFSIIFDLRLPPGRQFYTKPFGIYEVTTDESGLRVCYKVPGSGDGAVLFTDPRHEIEQFAIIGGRRSGEAWCKILSANEPDDEGDWNTLISNNSIFGKHFPWIKKNRFLDRDFKDLTQDCTPGRELSALQGPWRSTGVGETAGWSVTASCGPRLLDTMWRRGQNIVVELKKSISQRQQHPSPLIMKVPGKITWVIIPPKGGFMADVNGLRGGSCVNWVEHGGFFILYTKRDNSVVGMLPFRTADSKEEFFLLVTTVPNVCSAIKETNRGIREAWDGEGEEQAYSVVLSGGKVVYVTAKKYRNDSVADYLLTLTVKEGTGSEARGMHDIRKLR